MHTAQDDKRYDYNDSWWNPRFLDPKTENEFCGHFNASALFSAKIGFALIVLFWTGFGGFDLFLSPAVRSEVLVFRFAVILPILLILGGACAYKIEVYQPLLVLIGAILFAALIRVVVLYDDMGVFADGLGFELSMLNQDAKFIFVLMWIILLFVASLVVRVRTRTVLLLSIILLLAMLTCIYLFRPSALITAIAGPFIFACIPAVYVGSMMMERLALANYRSTKLLEKSSSELEKTLEILKTMFGRYLSTEVMASLIKNPAALELGGEKRTVTIMMTDLRGFTALAERLEPEQVVQMLNAYFEVMVEVVLEYQGTINEIIGDALIVIFGAPQEMPGRAQRAVACAIEMQNAMARVNELNCQEGLPELEMGIGLNETEVIVGNIGSSKRSKYTVVGSGVNMTSRIESYSVGGQVLVSESVFQETGDILRIDEQREIFPKGSETSLKIYEVGGIAGQYNLALEDQDSDLVTLARQIPFKYRMLEDKSVGDGSFDGFIERLSKKSAEMKLGGPLELFKNLKMNLRDVDENLANKHFYGKVVEPSVNSEDVHVVRFTAMPPEIDAYFQSHRQHSAILVPGKISGSHNE